MNRNFLKEFDRSRTLETTRQLKSLLYGKRFTLALIICGDFTLNFSPNLEVHTLFI